jgi:4-diphosphocytidyl-2-C-methyl-D-erythritol kinase
MAASLGADVPFLLSDDVMALAWGRGDNTLALAPLPQRDVLLLSPEFGIATEDAYRWLDADRASSGGSTGQDEDTQFRAAAEKFNSWSAVAANSRNDFLGPVGARHPRLLELLRALEGRNPFFCSMTGSGSTLFGIFDEPLDNVEFESAKDARTVSTRTSTEVVQPIRIG